MASVCFVNAEVVLSQLWIEIEKQEYKILKNMSFYNNMYGPSLSDTYKSAKINFITSWADDIMPSS